MTQNHDGQTSANPLSLSDRVRSLRLPERTTTAPRRGSKLPWFLCVVFLALAVAVGVYASNLRSEQARMSEELKSRAVSESTTGPGSAPVASSGEVAHEAKGNVTPVHQIQVSPKISGMVVDLDIIEGKWVPKGHILAKLEDINYRADYQHAQAALQEAEQNLAELTKYRSKEVDQAKARWDEAAAQAKQLLADRDRSRRLRNGNSLAERDWEQADASYLAMAAHARSLFVDYELLRHGTRDIRIEAAQRRVDQARADLVKAKWNLDNCQVEAPISGTILTKKAEMGNIVNPIAFNISASLCDMADLLDLEVDLAIQERDLSKIFVGQKCRIRPDAYPDHVYEGEVSRMMPQADRAKGAVSVRVRVKIPDKEKDEQKKGRWLKPEMGVAVTFFKK